MNNHVAKKIVIVLLALICVGGAGFAAIKVKKGKEEGKIKPVVEVIKKEETKTDTKTETNTDEKKEETKKSNSLLETVGGFVQNIIGTNKPSNETTKPNTNTNNNTNANTNTNNNNNANTNTNNNTPTTKPEENKPEEPKEPEYIPNHDEIPDGAYSYEQWLGAGMLSMITMQYDCEIKDIYLTGTTYMGNKSTSHGVYVTFVENGKEKTIYSKPLEETREESGTTDIFVQDIGYATYDQVDISKINISKFEKIKEEDLDELVWMTDFVGLKEN